MPAASPSQSAPAPIAMAEMKGAIGRIDETMNGLGRSIRRVEDYLQGTPKK